MNVRYIKPLNILSSALIAFNLGFCFSLLMLQWTWLELRFNTGLFIVAGLLLGVIYGMLISLKNSLLWGVLSVAVLLLTGLVIGRGVENIQIILGSMFREGVLIPSLTLKSANYIVAGIALLTLLVSWRLSCLQCSCRSKI